MSLDLLLHVLALYCLCVAIITLSRVTRCSILLLILVSPTQVNVSLSPDHKRGGYFAQISEENAAVGIKLLNTGFSNLKRLLGIDKILNVLYSISFIFNAYFSSQNQKIIWTPVRDLVTPQHLCSNQLANCQDNQNRQIGNIHATS